MNLTEPTRGYIYRILAALAAIAVAYGVATLEEVNLWLILALAVLGGGSGLAAANTPTHGDYRDD